MSETPTAAELARRVDRLDGEVERIRTWRHDRDGEGICTVPGRVERLEQQLQRVDVHNNVADQIMQTMTEAVKDLKTATDKNSKEQKDLKWMVLGIGAVLVVTGNEPAILWVLSKMGVGF